MPTDDSFFSQPLNHWYFALTESHPRPRQRGLSKHAFNNYVTINARLITGGVTYTLFSLYVDARRRGIIRGT